MRAIVVDDSRTIRIILGRQLRELGFEVFEAGNGAEALEVLGRLGPLDLALFDWNMPVMDGYELLRAVRQEARFAGMRIMMVTTETEVERVVRALEAGASEYLMKPFSKEAVQEKLGLLGIGAAS